MVVKVKAVKKGFFGGVRVPVGTVFEVEEDQLGKWMKVIEKSKPKKTRVADSGAS